MRPAEVWGCVSSPSVSSSASSFRTVEGETSSSARSTSVREPTGCLVATNSSTTPRRIARWRSLSSIFAVVPTSFAGILGKQLSRDAAPEEAATIRQRELGARGAPLDQPESLEPFDSCCVERALEPVERQRLVEPKAEEHALRLPYRHGQLFDLARGPLLGRKRCQVPAQPRCRLPPPTLDGRDRADPETQVVPAAPVGEVVP